MLLACLIDSNVYDLIYVFPERSFLEYKWYSELLNENKAKDHICPQSCHVSTARFIANNCEKKSDDLILISFLSGHPWSISLWKLDASNNKLARREQQHLNVKKLTKQRLYIRDFNARRQGSATRYSCSWKRRTAEKSVWQHWPVSVSRQKSGWESIWTSVAIPSKLSFFYFTIFCFLLLHLHKF